MNVFNPSKLEILPYGLASPEPFAQKENQGLKNRC
jgi:hypothetical protein